MYSEYEKGRSPDKADDFEDTKIIPKGEVFIATLAGISDDGQALIQCEELYKSGPIQAISTVEIEPRRIGLQVALMFVEGDIQRPIVVGYIRNQLIEMLDTYQSLQEKADSHSSSVEDVVIFESSIEKTTQDITNTTPDKGKVVLDKDTLLLEANDEICFKCGESSITLASDGKITIRGKYILNRASGLNRILGGSVNIN